MNIFQKILVGLSIVAQILPALLAALVMQEARIKPIKVTAGSVYTISGAPDASGDLIVKAV